MPRDSRSQPAATARQSSRKWSGAFVDAREATARPKHARELGDGPVAVVDVVERVVAGDRVEGAVGEGELPDVGQPRVEPALARRGDRSLRAVDTDDLGRGVLARDAAVAATDVEHPPWRDLGERREQCLLLVEVVEAEPAGAVEPAQLQAVERRVLAGDVAVVVHGHAWCLAPECQAPRRESAI